MKTDIHPAYQTVTFTCACGATFVAGSTLKNDSFNTEICSQCHPFYTGKQKLIDSSGRVDKFMEKMKKAQAHKEKQVKIVEEDDSDEANEESEIAKSEEKSTETKKETVAEELEELEEVKEEIEENTITEEKENEEEGEEEGREDEK